MAGFVEWVVANKLTAFLVVATGAFAVSTIALGVANNKCKEALLNATTTNTPSPNSTTSSSSTTSSTSTTSSPSTKTSSTSTTISTSTTSSAPTPANDICKPVIPDTCVETDQKCLKSILSQALDGATLGIHSHIFDMTKDVKVTGNFKSTTFNTIEVINFEILGDKAVIILRILGASVNGDITVSNGQSPGYTTNFNNELSFIMRVRFTYNKEVTKDVTSETEDKLLEMNKEIILYYEDLTKSISKDPDATPNVKVEFSGAVGKKTGLNKIIQKYLVDYITKQIIIENVDKIKSKIKAI